MYFSYTQAISWIKIHKFELSKIVQQNTIVFCPSFVSLAQIKQELENTSIAVGAQECSANFTGAYTGQVDALSLKQVGCSYCLVGHSEQRSLTRDYNVSAKLTRLLEQSIIPIICISEPSENQLAPLKSIREKFPKDLIITAYEPQEAIGTGQPAEITQVQDSLGKIKKYIQEHTPNTPYKLLYGGSVNGQYSVKLKKLNLIDGFLIGKASTDYEELTTIIAS